MTCLFSVYDLTSIIDGFGDQMEIGIKQQNLIHSFFFFYKNVVFPAQAEYSYFSADFRLKIVLYYS